MYRIGIVETEICEKCNLQEETIDYYLFHCTTFDAQRKEMYSKLNRLGVKEVTLKVVLGCDDRYAYMCKSILLILINYICSTNRISDI